MSDEDKKTKKPKRRACAQTKKNITRKTWYYREGEYFVNKRSYTEWKQKQIEEQKKAEEEAKAKAEEEAKAKSEEAKADA